MNNQPNIDENLIIAISLIQESHKLQKAINQPNGNKNDPNKEYYQILSQYFIQNNANKGKLIINNKKYRYKKKLIHNYF